MWHLSLIWLSQLCELYCHIHHSFFSANFITRLKFLLPHFISRIKFKTLIPYRKKKKKQFCSVKYKLLLSQLLLNLSLDDCLNRFTATLFPLVSFCCSGDEQLPWWRWCDINNEANGCFYLSVFLFLLSLDRGINFDAIFSIKQSLQTITVAYRFFTVRISP